MALLTEWIEEAIDELEQNERTPELLLIKKGDLKVHNAVWIKHTSGDYQTLSELVSIMQNLVASGISQTEKLDKEASEEFSSYSDYSETDTDSDEEDDEDEEEEKEEEESCRESRRKPYEKENVKVDRGGKERDRNSPRNRR